MADLIERDYLIVKFEDTGQPAVSEMWKGYDLGVAAALRVVKNAPAVNRWIPCGERLTEDQTRVLIKTIYGSMCIAKRCGNGDWYTDGSGTYHAHEVASWMPLPEEGGEQ